MDRRKHALSSACFEEIPHFEDRRLRAGFVLESHPICGGVESFCGRRAERRGKQGLLGRRDDVEERERGGGAAERERATEGAGR